MKNIRILFLADTHLGFDMPFKPRVKKRRRGPDFFANYRKALRPALDGEVDLVVHGGDLLFRSKVPAKLVEMAVGPLKEVADRGVPVFLVPGNHERSQIPYRLLSMHQNLHVFDTPQTFTINIGDKKLALGGFPYERGNVRRDFRFLLEKTDLLRTKADARLLCLHHCVEGAAVGPGDFIFKGGEDVIRAADIPGGLAAVLSGHIHRFQVLSNDLRGYPLNAPVLYPGSIERTSFAEKDEPKGYLIVEIEADGPNKGGLAGWSFHALPARPMVSVDVLATTMDSDGLKDSIRNSLKRLPMDSVVKVRLHGRVDEDAFDAISAPTLRDLAPPSMNVDVRLMDGIKPSPPKPARHRAPQQENCFAAGRLF